MEAEQTYTIFDYLIWSGVFLSLAGLCGLIWCIIFIARARKAKLTDDALKAKLQRALPLNLGSLFLSVIGLILVMLGIFLA